MQSDEVIKMFQDHTLALIDAKLKPVTGMMLGLEIAVLHLFNCLHHTGVLSREKALESLAATREGLPPDVPEESRLMLRHIEGWFEAELVAERAKTASSPETLRTLFRIVPGYLRNEPPGDKDQI